jgi:hypothetical protein
MEPREKCRAATVIRRTIFSQYNLAGCHREPDGDTDVICASSRSRQLEPRFGIRRACAKNKPVLPSLHLMRLVALVRRGRAVRVQRRPGRARIHRRTNRKAACRGKRKANRSDKSSRAIILQSLGHHPRAGSPGCISRLWRGTVFFTFAASESPPLFVVFGNQTCEIAAILVHHPW